MSESAVTLLFTESIGATDRIMGLLRRRGFPVTGLTLERTHRTDVARMTVTVGEADAVEQVTRHLRKLPDVLEVEAAGGSAVQREYALIRVACAPAQRAEVMALLTAFGAHAVSMTAGHLVAEATGERETLDALFTQLEPYGIEDSARTNTLAVRSVPADSDRRMA